MPFFCATLFCVISLAEVEHNYDTVKCILLQSALSDDAWPVQISTSFHVLMTSPERVLSRVSRGDTPDCNVSPGKKNVYIIVWIQPVAEKNVGNQKLPPKSVFYRQLLPEELQLRCRNIDDK
jgi:hypothetical protein